MRNELTVIDEREILGKLFRVYGDFENLLFLAKDVAEWIDYNKKSNGSYDVNSMLRMVDEDEKLMRKIFVSGQNREMWFLTEDGFYEVCMQSTKPNAKIFKKEVKKILKTIRKTGMYVTDELLNNPDLAIKAFTRLKEEQEKRMRLEKEIEEQAPAVAFANSLTVSKDCILVRELSKILKQNGIDVGETRLFEWLRQNGYLISKVGSDWNLPTQKSMNLGLFVIKEGTRMSTTEGSKITKTPKVTGKGQQYFLNKFLKNNRLMEVN
ncbi:phage antirepressor protein [Leptotrichia wadei]|uniref:Phage antirepressor protein n=1 Tax=Leptotrichia wadei TaxID=157687 RepID=A0A134A784_9FUSO|nr:phage antirepressor KilAC domain-containing protein [Leptotrichia wadei]KXB63340.1 phage antirepressor protein [Leptotrichia wadei]